MDGRWRRRGPEYCTLAQRLAARMLDLLHAHLPQGRDASDVVEVSTPLCTRHLANYAHGEISASTAHRRASTPAG